MADDQRQSIFTIAASIIVLVAIVLILKTLKGIFIPLVLSIFITYLFAPVVEFLAKLKIPRIASLFLMLIIVSLIGFFFARIIISNVKDFIDYWPSLEKEIFRKSGALFERYLDLDMTNIVEFLRSARIQELLSNVFNISFSVIGKFLLTVLLLVFIYLSYHNYPRLIRKAFEEKQAERIFTVMSNINEQIIRYIFFKTLISAGTGILTGVACSLLGIKFAALWGFLAFLLNYIPYIGSLIAVILPILLSFLQFPHSFIPYLTILVLLVIQIVIGSFLDPEIMGNRFNLSPIIILISLFFWGYVWGIVGTFLAVPITAIIKIVIQNIGSARFIAVLMSKKVE
jgi:AI-2 transport protein TqsA